MQFDDLREDEVLALLKHHGRRLDRRAETRCERDGRLLGAVYRLLDGLWVWSAGVRKPPEEARIEAAAAYLDALEDCDQDEERNACFEAATDILSSRIRPVAHPAVMRVDVDPSHAERDSIARPMSLVGGQGFLVTEVSCGCRRHYYLDLHALIQAAAGGRQDSARPTYIAPLPPDLPENEVRRLLASTQQARA